MSKIHHLLYNYLITVGISETYSKYLNMFALLIVLLIVVFGIDFILRKIIITAISTLTERTKNSFDDILVINKVPRSLAHILPLIITIKCIPTIFADFPSYEVYIQKGLQVFGILLVLWVARGLLNTLKDYFNQYLD